ncbi:DUF434 domain-containing protein [Sporolactobacillus vineae]|uniref:DUF434 domain-containing protein n=1 Tax=Sporolactobacillus vineae TaxID=444463 RepID=UPI0002887371|nr:DUF434 domain-containing protein [Sporolactobacillus vineae]
MKDVRRGYAPEDEHQFNEKQVQKLRTAQHDLIYLLNHNYPMKTATTFVGNHFQLSGRQRTALMRSSCSTADLRNRKVRQITGTLAGRTLFIDGFNLVITLETALSGSTLLSCMDGTIRDLCGLHGTYRLIDRTTEALNLIGNELKKLSAVAAVFILDRQISNSGRLKSRIMDQLQTFSPVAVQLSNHADTLLMQQNCVATSDSGILDQCRDWVNLARSIIENSLPEIRPVDLSGKRIEQIS